MEELLEPEEVEFTEADYDSYLNNAYELIHIEGVLLNPSDVLKETDPTAYSVGFNNYYDGISLWKCPVCNDEWDNYESAKYCCQTEEEN